MKPIGPIFLLLIEIIVRLFKLLASSISVENIKIKKEKGNNKEVRIGLLNMLANGNGNIRTKVMMISRTKFFLDQLENRINLFRDSSIHLKPNASKVRKKDPIISQMIPIIDNEY